MAPPKLPRDAFKQVSHEGVSSPFGEVVSSAPKPKLELPVWAGRPIAHPEHGEQLDLDAAVNEFGLKMPREQAEDEAYRQYLYHPRKGQHAQAALHHLAGMKAAHAAGDMEAAHKHSLMFNLHSKALGKQPHDAARELQAHVQQMPKVYKFKAHRGDAFAVNQPPPQAETGVISSTPPPQLNKREREVMYMLWLMGQAALKKGENEWKALPKGHGHLCWVAGCRTVGEAKLERNGKKYCMKHAKEKGYIPDTKKSEPSPSKKHSGHSGHCHCSAYDFCHRYGGGKCNVVKP